MDSLYIRVNRHQPTCALTGPGRKTRTEVTIEEPNLNSHNGDGVRSPTLRDLMAIAFRHRRLMCVSFVGILSGTIIVALLQTRR